MSTTKAPAQDAGQAAEPAKRDPPKIERSGWTKREARPGDEVFLVAKLSGYEPGAQVQFKVFPTTGSPDAPLANLRGFADERGLAFVEWVYVHDPVRVRDPRLMFEAEVEGNKTLSTVLVIVDTISLRLTDEKHAVVAGKEVRLVDALGFLHIGRSDGTGQATFERIACGDCMFTVPGYEIVGEMRPGDKKWRSGTKHDVAMREMTFTVEFESPKSGDVYLAGDRVPVKTAVKRVGLPWKGVPQVTANNGARLVGGAAPGQDAMKAETQRIVVLPMKDGEVELQAKFDKVSATVKLKVVRPAVTEVKFEGPDHFPLYEHGKGSRQPAYARYDLDGKPKEQHPGAFKFGKKLKAKLRVATAELLTNPAKIEIALTTPALDDTGLPEAGLEKGQAGKPLTLRLAKDKREAGIDFKGGEAGVEIEVESDRPLPNAVRSYKWNLDVRYNQKAGDAWTASDANLPVWPKLGDLRGLRVNAVFGEGKIAEGKDFDASADPLKPAEYDPFHVRKAAEWAQGGFDLLMGSDRSIPVRLVSNLRHHKWPEEYRWLRGKKAADHQQPANQSNHPQSGVYDGGAPPAEPPPVPAGYRCAACKSGPWPHPSAVRGSCPKCSGGRPGGSFMWLWVNTTYQCSNTGCNHKAGDVNPPPLCAGCRTPHTLLEVKTAEGEWVDEKGFMTGAYKAEPGMDPNEPGKEPIGKNWGFGVLDALTHPGGKPHQAASLVAAALGALGVKATVLYLRPRNNGAINLTDHDPVTRGAACFNPKEHWGRPFLAFVGIPVDKSRDDDLKGAKVHEEETWVLEAASRKRGLHKDAAMTAHEKKLPDPKNLVDKNCRCGHEYKIVSRKTYAATFHYSGASGQLNMSATGVKLDGEVAVEVHIPATLYGAGVTLEAPYGGQVALQGPAGGLTKQLAGAVTWKNEGGTLSTKVEFGGAAPGEYAVHVMAFFQGIGHHKHWGGATYNGQASITVHTRVAGQPRPESVVETVVEPSGSSATVTVKTSGRLQLTLVEGMLKNYRNQPFYKQGHKDGPVEAVTVTVDGGKSTQLQRGQPVEVGPVAAGDRKLTFTPARPTGEWQARIKVVANNIDESGKPMPCPTCGAQANWGYTSWKTGKPVSKDAKKDEKGNSLEGLFAQAIIYACPNCKKTVHDGDSECWACGAKLTARKPEDRFGQPAAASASGGEKQEDKTGKGGEGKDAGGKDDEVPQPVGRFDVLDRDFKAVLTLQPGGKASFLNFAYFKQPNPEAGYSLDQAKDVKWDAKLRVLTFVHARENGFTAAYKLTFNVDMTFTGTQSGLNLKGGPRKDPDGVPLPKGRWKIKANFYDGFLEVSGDDPQNMKGVINFGPFHPGYAPENLEEVKWDETNHTLTFKRKSGDQRYWVTFQKGGAVSGSFLHGGKLYAVNGNKG